MFDDATISIPCPSCGHKADKKIRWLKAHSEMTCARCGQEFALDTAELKSGLKAAEKSLADFTRKLGKLGK